ncbi:MAG: DUF4173 domain-containing protein [Chlorobia bacterium]|nr:DUF4173 domain-containing protein [Fimbriimonadaceae bacterium]
MAAPAIVTDQIRTTHRSGIAVIWGASVVGLVAALCIPTASWGIGFPAVVIAAFAVSQGLRRFSVVKRDPWADCPWIGILLFSVLFAWHDALELRFMNLMMVALFVGIIAIKADGKPISQASVYDYPFRALGSWFVAFIDTFTLLWTDIHWKSIPKNGSDKKLAAAGRGLLLAAPLVLIFGALFINADAGFEGLLKRIFSFDAEAIFQMCLTGGIFAWMAAGMWRRTFVGSSPVLAVSSMAPPKAPPRLGATEVGIILGSLNLLFLLFVSTQWRYFVGGAEVIRSTEGLGVATFARRGFFELATVSGLVLPTLLGLHSLADPDDKRLMRLYKIMASVLVVLLTFVMHSAWIKMQLYMESFGLTTLRLYVAAMLVWLVGVFGWFAMTILKGRVNRFAFGAVVAFAGMVLGLNVINPDRFVARWNLSHQKAEEIDWGYLTQLSNDAVPTLIESWDRIPMEHRSVLADQLLDQHSDRADWRSQTFSSQEARQRISGREDEIRKAIASP